jgi:hypothetical protein
VTEFFEIQRLWEHLVAPGAQPPVDLFPILQQVPEWLGAKWKGLCREVRKRHRNLYFGLLSEVEDRCSKGGSNGCSVEVLHERAKEWGLDREMVG